jgi:hypothetical protein
MEQMEELYVACDLLHFQKFHPILMSQTGRRENKRRGKGEE